MNKFEIVDMPGMNTLAFLVEKDDSLSGDMGLSLQKLEHLDREQEGKMRKEFNVISDDDIQEIVLVTLTNTKAIISTGELSDEGFVAKDNGIKLSYGSIFSADGIEYKEFVYTPNMKRRFSIIDTTTGEEVKPMLFMDETTKEVKRKCKLLPLRPYVVIEVKIVEE
jgi:hypothetical protein